MACLQYVCNTLLKLACLWTGCGVVWRCPHARDACVQVVRMRDVMSGH